MPLLLECCAEIILKRDELINLVEDKIEELEEIEIVILGRFCVLKIKNALKKVTPADVDGVEPDLWIAGLVSSVGRAPVCCTGGRWFEPQTGPTLRVLK